MVDNAHREKVRKEFWGKQRVIRRPEFRRAGNKALVVNAQLLGDFRTRDNFLESLNISWAEVLRFEISFDLRRGNVPKNKSDDLAFDEIEVNGYGKTKMTLFCQI